MKANSIQKSIPKKVEACDESVVLVQQEASVPECACKYATALEYLSAAIENLAEIAKDDPIAKDSIANIGVVMLDLKANC